VRVLVVLRVLVSVALGVGERRGEKLVSILDELEHADERGGGDSRAAQFHTT